MAELTGIAPGEYRLYAFDSFDQSSLDEFDYSQHKSLLVVKVQEKGRHSVDLDVNEFRFQEEDGGKRGQILYIPIQAGDVLSTNLEGHASVNPARTRGARNAVVVGLRRCSHTIGSGRRAKR